MNGRGEPQRTSASLEASPWGPQQRYITQGLEATEALALRPFEQFPDRMSVPISPQRETALAETESRALAGSPIVPAAQDQYLSTLRGDFLGAGNPAFDRMVERSVQPLRREFEDVVRPGITGAFSRAGRGGSNIASELAQNRANEAYLRSVGDVSASLAYPTYEAERGRQYGAAAQAPAFRQMDYLDPMQLGQVGAAREQEEELKLRERMQRFEYPQAEASRRLDDYIRRIQGDFGGTRITESLAPETRSNPFMGMLGGGMLGANIGGMTNPVSGAMMAPGAATYGMLPYMAGGAALGALSGY